MVAVLNTCGVCVFSELYQAIVTPTLITLSFPQVGPLSFAFSSDLVSPSPQPGALHSDSLAPPLHLFSERPSFDAHHHLTVN